MLLSRPCRSAVSRSRSVYQTTAAGMKTGGGFPRQRSRPAAASIRRPTALSAARSSARPSVCLFLGIHVHENAMNPSDSFRLLDEEDLKISEEARARHP
jgi:hypothetical protein